MLKKTIKKWSPAWKSSKNPRKQRKYRKNAPLHIKREFLNVHLSKELRQKYGVRSMIVRKNDVVKVMRGEFKGTKSAVSSVSVRESKVFLKDVVMKKKDGATVKIAMEPSNLMIVSLSEDDKKRFKRLVNSK